MAKKAKKAKRAANKTKPCSDGRNGKGQFAKGNKGGTGSKHKATELGRALKAAFTAAVTEQDIKDIVLGLTKKAKAGDVLAAREVFDRLWGKSTQAITGEGGGAIQFGEIIVKLASGKKSPGPNVEAST